MKKGVSLISLVVTIIVLIILAGISIMTIQKNNPIDKAKEAVSETDLEANKDELRISVANRLKDDPLLQKNSINASSFDEMKKYIPSLTKEIAEKYEIVNGELVLRGTEGEGLDKPDNSGPGGHDNIDPDNPDIENNRPPKPDDDTYDMGTPNMPELANGMIPIKFDGTDWIICSKTDPEWYNYAHQKWANVMLSDGKYKTSEKNKYIIGETKVKDEELGSMFVWIPRFAYSINEFKKFEDFEEHERGTEEGSIKTNKHIVSIKFLKGKTNKFVDKENKEHSYKLKYDYKDVNVGQPTPYIVHPGFNIDKNLFFIDYEKPLNGIWFAKFEASRKDHQEGLEEPGLEGNLAVQNSNPNSDIKILPGRVYWTHLTLGKAFIKCYEMKDVPEYGLKNGANEDLNKKVDTHLMKNTEWSAVAYLSVSPCGKPPIKIKINSKDQNHQWPVRTGATTQDKTKNYRTETRHSTTRNITGVYDMNGGTEEFVAAYFDTGRDEISKNGNDKLDWEYKNANIEPIFDFKTKKLNSKYEDYFNKYEVINKDKDLENNIMNKLNQFMHYNDPKPTEEEIYNNNKVLFEIYKRRLENIKNNFVGDGIYEILSKPGYFLSNPVGIFIWTYNPETAKWKLDSQGNSVNDIFFGDTYNHDKFQLGTINFPFIVRGGKSADGARAGLFAVETKSGAFHGEIGFRPAIYIK